MIDEAVYELNALTAEEIKVVEAQEKEPHPVPLLNEEKTYYFRLYVPFSFSRRRDRVEVGMHQ
ncbi:hypothetical protein JNL27_17465 [bacterium]|nr:hypothetical protein [bacterium]